MSDDYRDLLHLPHPTSRRHPRMARAARAAQFSPFSALTGYADAIAELSRPTEDRVTLAEDAANQLDRTLRRLAAHTGEPPLVTVRWFVPDGKRPGGRICSHTGRLLRVEGGRLFFDGGAEVPTADLVAAEEEHP